MEEDIKDVRFESGVKLNQIRNLQNRGMLKRYIRNGFVCYSAKEYEYVRTSIKGKGAPVKVHPNDIVL